MPEDNKFGISDTDKEILDRLKNNREKKLSPDADKIEPVIHYGESMTAQERRERKNKRARERADERAMEQSKQSNPVKTLPDKKIQMKGKIKPEISYDGDATILTWKRHFTSVLSIPSEIGLVGWVSLQYNTKTKELIIRGITEAK